MHHKDVYNLLDKGFFKRDADRIYANERRKAVCRAIDIEGSQTAVAKMSGISQARVQQLYSGGQRLRAYPDWSAKYFYDVLDSDRDITNLRPYLKKQFAAMLPQVTVRIEVE